jgi:DNA-binding response OmpR family regulator
MTTTVNGRATRILVVEDEPQVAEVVGRYLERDGHDVRIVGDGDAALRAFEEQRPDLVVLDLMIPEPNGYEVCEQIRRESEVAVIMLTARTTESDRLMGLDLGADDYVTKPFSPRELAARVRTVLRRTRPIEEHEGSLHVGPFRLDPETRDVRFDDRQVELTALEFDLLWHLALHPRRVFSRDELLNAVWGEDYEGGESTVTVHMRRLRSKLEPDPARPRHLMTVWGVGYRLEV